MKTFLIINALLISSLFYGCSTAQSQETKTVLTATEFNEQIRSNPQALVIDVRSPSEFSESHLVNAKNIDWNGIDFENQISKLDKSQPVYVYCKGGARSEAAAKKMRDLGFLEVYELEGGILKWQASNLPIIK